MQGGWANGYICPGSATQHAIVWELDGSYIINVLSKRSISGYPNSARYNLELIFGTHKRYVATPGDPTYIKGNSLGTVWSFDPNAYPNGGVYGDYYYELS